MKQRHRSCWKWLVVALAVVAGVVALAVLISYSVQQSKRNAPAVAAQAADWRGTSSAGVRSLAQLPPPGSPDAAALLARNDTPAWVVELYAYHRDSASITPELTAQWLQLLQQQLQEQGAAPATNSSSKHPAAAQQHQQQLDLQPFISVAADVLAYLRYMNSRSLVLLSLLREYAASGVISLESVDPDALQSEVKELFSLQNLNMFFLDMARVDGSDEDASAMPRQAAVLLATSKAAAELRGRMLRHSMQKQRQPRPQRQQLRHLLLLGQTEPPTAQQAALETQLISQMMGGSTTSSAASGGSGGSSNRGTNGSSRSPDFMSSGSSISGGSTSAPRDAGNLAAASTAGSTGGTSSGAAGSSSSSSSSSTLGVQTLLDMVCSAAPWAPQGSLGTVLPAGSSCPTPAPLQLFKRDSLAFRPVTVPLVFHVLRFLVDLPASSFMSTDVQQAPFGSSAGTMAFPPMWDGSSNSSSEGMSGTAAGQNLVDVVNRLFANTGVQFSLKEVRADPSKYPYLVQKSKTAWLNCSFNAAATADGLACLRGIAHIPEVATLATQEHMVNVFVSGSDGKTDYTYCTATAADPRPLCSTISRGYTAARGPWFLGAADPGWSEDNSGANWVFLSWGNFDVGSWNKGPWNGGGATLAHELGHFFGLLHTFEGAPACLNGPDAGDAVLDTPPNQNLESWQAGGTEAVTLASWCSDFRNGKGPSAEALAAFQSCPNSQDNFANIMSYVPDACSMILTPGQVERMQWAIAVYRPGLMQAHASQK